jgi:hypothetical protein
MASVLPLEEYTLRFDFSTITEYRVLPHNAKTNEVFAIIAFIGSSEAYGTRQKDRAEGLEQGE